MNRESAKILLTETFDAPFDEGRFNLFASNLLNDVDTSKGFPFISGNYIRHSFKNHISKYRRLGSYTDSLGETMDILVVKLKNDWALERSRTMLRNFTADYLENRGRKDAALVAYYTNDPNDWRFSYIRMDYKQELTDTGKIKVRRELTPARRYSFLVGVNEPNHTAQAQLLDILEDDKTNPSLSVIEAAFSVDAVSKQFYLDYRDLFERIHKELDRIVNADNKIANEFEAKSIDTANFAKKLMGQIVFLYFLQKKGWLGVRKDENGNFKKWGTGPKNFLHRLFKKEYSEYNNFFNDVLEPLFYEALASEHDDDYFSSLDCKIPFLNGGLFEALNGYNWREADILIDNDLLSDIFTTFDQYNFTVREDEPMDKEVAIDPEMLGKVFENLLPENLRKGKGAYYTPRTIVHYMCQESLINYLDTEIKKQQESFQEIGNNQLDALGNKPVKHQLKLEINHHNNPCVPKADLETLIREGDIILELETAIYEDGKKYRPVLMDSIKDHAQLLDDALANIKVCDPAIGSGAFPVGMLNEIVKARKVLELYLDKKETTYTLKRHCIQESIYGVDIDPGAVDIAKLRLWLSLVVDENDYSHIQALPNLDYKIMQGNSLVEEFHGISLDIEKRAEQIDAFSGGSSLDVFIEDLHQKQAEFFDAEHPQDKKKKRQHVETAINNIFHYELEKRKSISPQKSEEIGADLKEMTHGNKVRNFFPWKLYFADIFREKGGFNIIIANPPYIGQKGNKEIFQDIKSTDFGAKYHQRRMDYYYFFFHKAMELVKEKGLISFITTNYYTTATYSDKLRLHMYSSCSILNLINFNELKIFESALGQHNMITTLIKDKKNDYAAHTVVSHLNQVADAKILSNLLNGLDYDADYFIQKQDEVFEENSLYVRIEPGHDVLTTNIYNVLDKVKAQSLPLSRFCNIEQGIVSGADRVSKSILKKYPNITAENSEGIFILNNSELDNLSLSKEELRFIKKTYKNSSIKRWWFQPNDDLNVVYIKSTGKYFNIGIKLAAHFNRFKILLINRNVRVGTISEKEYENFLKGKEDISYIMNASSMKAGNYFCISYPRRGPDTFEVPKIVNSRRARTNTFALENRGYYEQSDIVVTTLKPEMKEMLDLRYILSILNSKLYYCWLYYRGKRKGEILEIFQKPLSEVPIMKISLSKQKPFINLADNIISITKHDPQADITVIENEIDQLVYQLYELTNEEIAIVEESVKTK